MSIERMVLVFAGGFPPISTVLPLVLSLSWLFYAAFVDATLFRSAFPGFCPLANTLKSFGAKPSGETFKY